MVKDMYADLEKIEARGKRKKEKSKGLFSSFGKKDEPEPEQETQDVQEEAAPATEAPGPEPEPAPPTPKPAAPAPVEEAAPAPPTPKPAEPAPVAQAAPAPQHPEPAREKHNHSGWQPPTGAKLRKAEEELLEYKRWLNKGFKSGMLSKEQCVDMVKKKELELGLRPPE